MVGTSTLPIIDINFISSSAMGKNVPGLAWRKPGLQQLLDVRQHAARGAMTNPEVGVTSQLASVSGPQCIQFHNKHDFVLQQRRIRGRLGLSGIPGRASVGFESPCPCSCYCTVIRHVV